MRQPTHSHCLSECVHTTPQLLIWISVAYIHSYEATTQPYVPSTSPVQYKPNFYSGYKKPESTTTTTTTTTTKNPYKYHYYSTTRKPYEYTQKQSTVTHSTYPPSINKYSISTTRSPYDFHDFFAQTTKATEKPEAQRRGFYTKAEFDSFFGRSTTKSPYSNKPVKSIFKFGTYYSQAKSNDNSIRPDASQQVHIEPARLVYSYQRNLTAGETQN